MITKLYSACVVGLETHLITVELLIKHARQSFNIAGLVGAAANESRNRLSAVLYAYDIDLKDLHISVNLSPSNIKKTGASFDLPIVISILKALDKIKIPNSFLDETLFVGELSFDGSLRSIDNIVPIILDAQSLGIKRVIVPLGNYPYSDFASGVEVIGLESLDEFHQYLRGELVRSEKIKSPLVDGAPKQVNDFASVKGQSEIKRMLQIAVAGGHHAIMVGPPGSGKTMLANCAQSLMATMSVADKMETTRIYSSHQSFNFDLVQNRPFRSPHHSITTVGMTGGGSPIMPGELSLAHNGILFLDELTEFRRSVIENLRQPIESRHITISRASNTLKLPCAFTLISSMNPCPCGNLGSNKKECLCAPIAIYTYLNKISGPFLDRIDLQSFMQSVDINDVSYAHQSLDTATLLAGANKARDMQLARYGDDKKSNGTMSAKDIEDHCVLDAETKKFMDECYDKYHMSMRSYHKIIKVARTIADIGGEESIKLDNVKEALMYRGLEQKLATLKQKL